MPVASNPVFPVLPGVSMPLVRSPIWSTTVQSMVAGTETALQLWTYPRYKYSLNMGWLREAVAFGEVQTLMGFYNNLGGRAGVFQYDDTHDDTTVADQLFGIGDGATLNFQLVRAYGGFIEPVFAVNTVTNIKKNGVTLTNGIDYLVSNKGVVSFAVPPAGSATLTWTGTFLWFCRFDQDSYDFNLVIAAALTDPFGPIWGVSSLSFTTIKFGS